MLWLLLSFGMFGVSQIAIVDTAFATVTRTYIKADAAFKKGQVRRALKIISGNIKKYPAHEPSQLLLGRIYYRLGKVPQAAKAFGRVSPELLSADMAYEYGITFFITKNCDKAEIGRAHV